ncbi:MAG: protein-glutamate O-methyltransferase CheR [Bdellovibrionaceae bacterium]|nr:protein-glutamate O-methyltransferase CheR [Pseudobdellovibrionaceae bacterium]
MTATASGMFNASTTPNLEEEDLIYFCKVIEDRAGISLKSTKRDLVRTRLRSRVTDTGFNSYGDYRNYLMTLPKDHAEWENFTNLLTTNKTDFFREPKHFEYLVQKILPEWLKNKERTFKVWSAASSTGEEAFTLAMVLARYLPKDRDFKILATDIDTDVLSTAQNSVYPISKKPEIPSEYYTPCIDLGKGDARGWFRMKPHLREKIIFKQHNLIDRTSPGNGVFDLVVCRNVLIYFSPDTIDFVQKKIFTTVKPNGYLFIGHSESFQGIPHQWSSAGPSVFRKGS